MLYKHGASSLLWTLLMFSCTAQQPSNDLSRYINTQADSFYRATKVPGIFIGVLDKGKAAYYNFGYADPDKKEAFDSTTIFEAGSITKTFTAYVLVSVLGEKNIPDTSSIIGFLPDSVKANTALQKISFLNLMNHTSCLPRLPGNMDMFGNKMLPYDNYTEKDLYAYLKTAEPKPDGKSNYSNLGMGLAGVLAERISGKSYAALLDDYIFLPLKIVSADNSIEKSVKKSQGYFEGDKSVYWNMNVLAPAGGLKCSAKEMLAYLENMSVPSNANARNIINKLLEPTIAMDSKRKVCRAWVTYERPDKPVVYWHNGGTFGFSTFAAFIKERKQAVIVVVNKYNSNAVSDALGIGIMKRMTE